MIAHVSIPTKNPKDVANLLGKLIRGKVFNFPVVKDAFIVIAEDASGTAIEVYPMGMNHHPGRGEAPANPGPVTVATKEWEDQIFLEETNSDFSSHHMAIVTHLSEEEVIRLGKLNNFRTVPCDRAGVFKLVEIWIDNSYLIEVLIEKEAARYRGFMNPQVAAEMFGPAIN